MPIHDDTIAARPLPRKPDTGLQAWLATVGYIASEYSPDAALILRAAPGDAGVVWSARVAWGQVSEAVDDLPSLMAALRGLWLEVERAHRIFKTLEAATKRPANYPEHLWVDASTAETLERLIAVTGWAFATDWALLFIYRPVEAPEQRVIARLSAVNGSIHVGGQGTTLQSACFDLYRNAAPDYFARAGRHLTDFFTTSS
ncbi:MAG: hypothetical protein ACUVS2_04325 [Candidatus Flexifilum sp.]